MRSTCLFERVDIKTTWVTYIGMGLKALTYIIHDDKCVCVGGGGGGGGVGRLRPPMVPPGHSRRGIME